MPIDVVNVGHGACVVMRSGDSVGIIDVGNPTSVRAFLGTAKRDIDFVVLTHLDWDHVSALHWLLDSGHRVGRLYYNTDLHSWLKHSATYGDAEQRGRAAALEDRIFHEIALQREAGHEWYSQLYFRDELQLGEYNLDVLWPPREIFGASPRKAREILGGSPNRNDLSIALRIRSATGGRVVLAGDCGSRAIDRSVGLGSDWRCEILIYPHHGGDLGGSDAHSGVDLVTLAGTVIFQNGKRHTSIPKLETLQYFGRKGTMRVLCTGVAHHCCAESYANGVACAGDIRIDFDHPAADGSVPVTVLTRRERHRDFVRSGALTSAQCSADPDGTGAAELAQ